MNLNNSFEKKIITEHLWARPYDDYTEQTINQILNYTNKKYLISGHTNYNGCHIIGNQLIFDSSHNTETKYYLEIQLNKKYENIIEILKSKELEEYEGELPIIFYEYISIRNRREYLESIGEFYEYANLKELRKSLDADKQLTELIQFVNMNEEFQDIVKIKE